MSHRLPDPRARIPGHPLPRRLYLIPVLGLLACAGPAFAAQAPDYPVRPVRFIVPFPPGGANDIVARLMGQALADKWGRPVVIDNRGGAGGNIGTEIGAKAAPDGYTLLLGSTSTLATNVTLYDKLPFDPVKDLAPIALIATAPNVLVVHPSVAAASVQELIGLAKSKPGALNYSSFGSGSSSHLVAEMFRGMAGINVVHVPYKGGGPALAAVVAGEVQFTFSNMSVALPQVKAGKLRALAITSAKRSGALPEAPTVAEAALPGFEATAFVGLLAPAKTPRAIINRVHGDIVALTATREMKSQFAIRGLDLAGSSPEQFGAHIKTEIARWGKVIKASGARPEP